MKDHIEQTKECLELLRERVREVEGNVAEWWVDSANVNIDEALASLSQLKEQLRWIPTSERLPDAGIGEVLVLGPGLDLRNGQQTVAVGWYQHSMNSWSCDKYMNVTHWRPLPPSLTL